MGETLEVHEYDRFTPLRVEEGGLKGRYRNERPGVCIVAFSRKDIFTIKQVRRRRIISDQGPLWSSLYCHVHAASESGFE